MRRGRLIALEGIDGAGTSTQAALLVKALCQSGYPCHLTREPSDGPVGMLIRQILSHRLVVPGPPGPRAPRMETMALLFAADRSDHVEAEIQPNLMQGIHVVCDRYLHSSVAYQTLTSPEAEDLALRWVTEINSKSTMADLVLVLDVPAEEAARRRERRGGVEQMYEENALQERLAAFYASLPRRFPEQPIQIIDGSLGIEEVYTACLTAILRLLEEDSSCVQSS